MYKQQRNQITSDKLLFFFFFFYCFRYKNILKQNYENLSLKKKKKTPHIELE